MGLVIGLIVIVLTVKFTIKDERIKKSFDSFSITFNNIEFKGSKVLNRLINLILIFYLVQISTLIPIIGIIGVIFFFIISFYIIIYEMVYIFLLMSHKEKTNNETLNAIISLMFMEYKNRKGR